MPRFLAILIGVLLLCLGTSPASAQLTSLSFFVDSAPGDPQFSGWTDWWGNTITAMVSGHMINMPTGRHIGSLQLDPLDEMLSSEEGGGKRLEWVYYIPGVSIASLNHFEIKWSTPIDGHEYSTGWIAPDVNSMSEFDVDGNPIDGVVGHFGFGLEPGQGMPGNPVGVDPDTYGAFLLASQPYASGKLRYAVDENGHPIQDKEYLWHEEEVLLRMGEVPEPGTVGLLGIVLLGGVVMAIRQRRA